MKELKKRSETPANGGPTGEEGGGGRRGELLHLTTDFLLCPAGREGEGNRRRINQKQKEEDKQTIVSAS